MSGWKKLKSNTSVTYDYVVSKHEPSKSNVLSATNIIEGSTNYGTLVGDDDQIQIGNVNSTVHILGTLHLDSNLVVNKPIVFSGSISWKGVNANSTLDISCNTTFLGDVSFNNTITVNDVSFNKIPNFTDIEINNLTVQDLNTSNMTAAFIKENYIKNDSNSIVYWDNSNGGEFNVIPLTNSYQTGYLQLHHNTETNKYTGTIIPANFDDSNFDNSGFIYWDNSSNLFKVI